MEDLRVDSASGKLVFAREAEITYLAPLSDERIAELKQFLEEDEFYELTRDEFVLLYGVQEAGDLRRLAGFLYDEIGLPVLG